MNWGQEPQPGGHGGSLGGWTTPPVPAGPPGQMQPEAAGFGPETQFEMVTPSKPPMIWLAIGFLLTVVAVAIASIGQSATTGLIGWILAGPCAISSVAVFITQDAKRRESGWYTPSGAAEWGRRILVLVALLAVTLCAWFIANDVARGVWL